MSGTNAAFTIVAKNYLALAKVLAASLKRVHPDMAFHLLVVDRAGLAQDAVGVDGVELLDGRDIMDAAEFNRMATDYDITEFSTSVKPFVLARLLERGYEKVFYFDPDILIMRRVDLLLERLDAANIVLTPHLLSPIPLDGRRPSEAAVLASGAYNLGFLGVRNTVETRRFVDWWSERLRTLCTIDLCNGLFVDQKWIDLVPGMFEGVDIVKHPGCNVAYWNIHSRPLVQIEGEYFVREERSPLIFFHFSGYNADRPDQVSRHYDRSELNDSTVLKGLFDAYRKRLLEQGHDNYKSLPYQPGTVAGINLYGYVTAALGVGEAARGYARCLDALGVPHAVRNIEEGLPSEGKDGLARNTSSQGDYPVNLICVNADQAPRTVRRLDWKRLRSGKNIGVWAWELPEFPPQWKGSFRYFDEIWVGSEFARQAVERESPVPVVAVPLAISVELNREYDKNHFGLDDDEFVFLFMFDFNSVFERKNPLAVVRAFKRAFASSDPARLVLKCINAETALDESARLRQEIGDAAITVMSGFMEKDEKNGLLSVCDAYVSLHRSEGFGITMAEAMYLGKPVIATGWSGNVDFMSPRNSHLVDYQLIELEADFGPYRKGERWAEPSVEHAAELMREVFADQPAASALGERAAAAIRESLSMEAVGNRMQERFYQVMSRSRPPALGIRVLMQPQLRKGLAAVAIRLIPWRLRDKLRATLGKRGWR